MRHQPGGPPHEFANRAWQARRARTFGLPSMADFVVAHGLDDRATTLITGWQPIEMCLEVPLDLALGFRDEAETGLVTEQCGDGSDAERSGIPQRVQDARSGTELSEPRLAPGEVVG